MSKITERVSIDDALAETKFGLFNYLVIGVSGLILINVILECVGISFVLPVIDCDMDLSFTQKGILGAVGFLGMISSSHLWGFLADTTGRRNVIRPTLLAGYFVTVISSFSPNFWTLAFFRYLNGFMLAGSSATIYAYLGEFHCNKVRNRALMIQAFISAATSILSPLSAWAIINQNWSLELSIINLTYTPWRMYILLIGSTGLIAGLSLFFIPESPKYLLSVGKEEEAIKVIRKMYRMNTGKSEESFSINSIRPDNEEIQRFKVKNKKSFSTVSKSMWDQTVPLLNAEHCRKTVLACFIQFWTFYSAHGLYMWFPYTLNKVMQFTKANPDARLDIGEIVYTMVEAATEEHFNSTEFSYEKHGKCDRILESSTYKHTLFLEFIYLGILVFSGFSTEKIGRIPSLFGVLFICGLCGVLSAVITMPMIAVYFHIILLVCGLATTIINIIVVDIFPTNLRAMAVCISLMMGRIGSVTGASVVGMLIEHHCKTSIFIASIPLTVCSFLSLLLPSGLESMKDKKISSNNLA